MTKTKFSKMKEVIIHFSIKTISLAAAFGLLFLLPPRVSPFYYGGCFQSGGGVGVWNCTQVTYRVNGGFETAIARAAATWTNEGTRFRLVQGPTTTASCAVNGLPNTNDGINTVSVCSDCIFDPMIVAFTCTKTTAMGGFILEADICFNSHDYSFCDGACPGSYDIESIALHEFGHWIPLGEANQADRNYWDPICNGTYPVMASGFLPTNSTKRTLTMDDKKGLQYAYSCQGIITGTPRNTPDGIIPDANCNYPPPPPQEICTDPCPSCVAPPITCENLSAPNSVLVCPGPEVDYVVTVVNGCGQPQCYVGVKQIELNFNNCSSSAACPNQQFWTGVPVGNCDPLGEHHAYIDAKLLSCISCSARLGLAQTIFPFFTECKVVQAKFFDTNGDGCVDSDDYTGESCNDYNVDGNVTSADATIFGQHLFHDCHDASQIRGDMNNDGILDPLDVVAILNCVFTGKANALGACCGLSFADLNCDGGLAPSDVILLLNAVFLGDSFPC